jgi:hypothetical protein
VKWVSVGDGREHSAGGEKLSQLDHSLGFRHYLVRTLNADPSATQKWKKEESCSRSVRRLPIADVFASNVSSHPA